MAKSEKKKRNEVNANIPRKPAKDLPGSYGSALYHLQQDPTAKATRLGWDNEDEFIYMVPTNTYTTLAAPATGNKGSTIDPMIAIHGAGKEITSLEHIDRVLSDGRIVIGWVASIEDLGQEDWYII